MDLGQARHAFVTGGASGIGLAIAQALAAREVGVTVADSDAEGLAQFTADGRLRGQHLDVRDRAAWVRAKAECEAALGPVDILVNNAGIPGGGDHLADMDPQAFDEIVAINLVGVFNGISTFGAGMRARGRGHIVNTSSLQGMAPDGAGAGGYAAAKAGVIAVSEVLRAEMAPHGVGVSAFCPGMTLTPMVANALARANAAGERTAALRVTPKQPEEVAEIVLRGIEENRAYIFTHPERRSAVENRFAGVMAGFDGI